MPVYRGFRGAGKGESGMEALTYSRISMRARCPQREHFHYDLLLRSKQVQWALDIGSAFHHAMEIWNRGCSEEEAVTAALAHLDEVANRIDDEAELNKLPAQKIRVEVMVRQAVQRFPRYEPVVIEHKFDLPIKNPLTGRPSRTFRLAGKIDGVVRTPDGKYWLVEYKSTGQTLEQFRLRYGLDAQISLYTLAARDALGIEVEGALIRVLVKSRFEPRKGESLEDFKARLTATYEEESERFISEDLVVRTPEQLEQTRWELWAEVQSRLFDQRLGVIRRNPQACTDFGGCPFRAICLGLPGWEDMYYTADTQHDELSGDGQEAKTA
ncbi:PD-(D/E)XK nuclease superfamily protein [Alicyclobacillus macrosporangiidus]|uniref:PD-(D/E)XK nuclease superfamily protein n=2 Tax=Alicyclobacillus macrosporangiidus TaxID=392015 RepID=A0A1I7J9X3_9BACL|nr:PD-(D/E)XK nuclease superfamily protein [Alicyclobacillus macrosporangiidus]